MHGYTLGLLHGEGHEILHASHDIYNLRSSPEGLQKPDILRTAIPRGIKPSPTFNLEFGTNLHLTSNNNIWIF